jgi:hypothetical protein
LIWLPALALASRAAAAPDRTVWPLLPYRVQVFVAASPQPPITPALRDDLCARLSDRIVTVVGAGWNATVSPAPPQIAADVLRGIETLQPAQLVPLAQDADKILLLAVRAAPDGIALVARDFDVPTRTLSTPVSRHVWQTAALCDTAFDTILSAFAPLGRMEAIDRKKEGLSSVLRVKASGLAPRDPHLVLLREGDIFRPVLRYSDRQNKFKKAVAALWSYCVVTAITPEAVRCVAYTGMLAETIKPRGRVELLALRVIPPRAPTTLFLWSVTEPKQLLSNYQIYCGLPGEKEPKLLGKSDRLGRIVVPPGDGALKLLVIREGTLVLSKLPLVPGVEPQLAGRIHDCDPRVEAEGFVTGMREELVDVVLRRKILMLRIDARLKSNEEDRVDQASKMLEEMQRLPSISQFSQRIAQEKAKLVSNDSAVQRKVDGVLKEFEDDLKNFFDPRGVEQIDKRVREARETADARPDTKEQAKE